MLAGLEPDLSEDISVVVVDGAGNQSTGTIMTGAEPTLYYWRQLDSFAVTTGTYTSLELSAPYNLNLLARLCIHLYWIAETGPTRLNTRM